MRNADDPRIPTNLDHWLEDHMAPETLDPERDAQTRMLFDQMMCSKDDRVKEALNFYIRGIGR